MILKRIGDALTEKEKAPPIFEFGNEPNSPNKTLMEQDRLMNRANRSQRSTGLKGP